MPISRQVLKNIKIEQLKGLRNVQIDFQGNCLTALMGPNGVGKTTLLHALACIYSPPPNVPDPNNYQFQTYFTPTTHTLWAGSRFSIIHDYQDGPTHHADVQVQFKKSSDRWTPRKESRTQRTVIFIGIRTSVPEIEKETQKTRIQFNVAPVQIASEQTIRQHAGVVMNRQYTALHQIRNHRKLYTTVEYNGITYSSLFMGAGEQRIIHILKTVIDSPNSAMILIEEIDILLHQDALEKLLNILNTIATQKRLQIIFTTHAHSILHLPFINFRHLLQTPTDTLCFNETKPDALHRLIGQHIRPLEICVEDDLASVLVEKVAAGQRMAKYLSVMQFGAATNCFTFVAATFLRRTDNRDNMLFVLDGDAYRTDELKRPQIARALSGTAPADDQNRAEALQKITQFVIPENQKPEQYYHSLICTLDDNQLSQEELDWVMAAREIANVPDAHLYFNRIIERMGATREVGLTRLVDLLSKSQQWSIITQHINDWLLVKRPEVVER